jgi:hypothetical protein
MLDDCRVCILGENSLGHPQLFLAVGKNSRHCRGNAQYRLMQLAGTFSLSRIGLALCSGYNPGDIGIHTSRQ